MLTIVGVGHADYFLKPGGGGCCARVDASAAEYQFDAMAKGEPPGRWFWVGENALGLEGSIVAGARSGDEFKIVLDENRDPTKPKRPEKVKGGKVERHPPLGRRAATYRSVDELVEVWQRKHPQATPEQVADYRLKASNEHKDAKRGFDAVFSPDKSWSVLHAALQWAGRYEEAEKLWQAWELGVETALRELHRQLGYIQSRPSGPELGGRRTARYERARNLQSALFRHHVSRAGDPQIHVHALIINRALNQAGEWRALYSPAFFKAKHWLDQVATRAAEAEAMRSLGLTFVTCEDGMSRSIEGVPREVMDFFSSRARQVTERAREIADAFEATKRRAPSQRELWNMEKEAGQLSRKPKPRNPPPRAEQLDAWEEAMSSRTRESFEEVLEEVDALRQHPDDTIVVPSYDPDRVIEQALADLTERKSVWNKSHLVAALSKALPAELAVAPDEVAGFLSDLAERAITRADVVSTEAPPAVVLPASLTDAGSGRSVFEAPDGRTFTTRVTLDREDSLIARLDRRGAPRVPINRAVVLVEGSGLADEQTDLVTRTLSSGMWLEVVDAAAGTGKSTTARSLSNAATEQWGIGVTGFTVAENAAAVLRHQGLERAHNIAAFLDFRERAARGAVSDTERARFAIARGSYVWVDEASTVPTAQLVELVAALDEAGAGKVILVGDRRQADPVDAGGAFGMLIDELERRETAERRALPPSQIGVADTGVAAWTGEGARERVTVSGEPSRVHRLRTVRRFSNSWEADASTRVREGDVTALQQYEARGRVHGSHDRDEVRNQAVTGFVTDYLSGRDSVIITGTTEEASAAAWAARVRLAEAGHVEADGIPLRDNTVAGIGDMVQSRLNSRDVGARNRQRWQVVGRADDGALEVREELGRDSSGERRWGPVHTLPATYTLSQLELGYATTVLAIEGTTIHGTSHTIANRMMGRSHVYVGLGRATEENHVYLELAEPAPQRPAEPDEDYLERVRPETPIGRLAAVVGRDDNSLAARSVMAIEDDRATNVGNLGPVWETLVRETRAVTHREVLRHELRDDAERVLADPSVGRLYGLLRGAELAGHEPAELVAAAAAWGSLDWARSPASALYARIEDEKSKGPLPRPVPVGFEARTPPPSRGDVENERLDAARAVGRVLDRRAAELGQRAALDQPQWAVRTLGPAPTDPDGRARWVGDVSLACAYRERYGIEDEHTALGRRPPHAEPERTWLYDMAAKRLGIPEYERDLHGRNDGELALRVAEWERAQSWAPRYVDPELLETHLALQHLDRQIVDARIRGEDTSEFDGDRARMLGRRDMLEEIAEHRQAWYERHREVQERAEEAQRELDRRGDLERARVGVPLPREPEDDEPEVETEAEREEREAREAEDREAVAHAAVFGLLSTHHQPDAPEYGSASWLALEADDPRREAAVVQAAVAWWNIGEGRDQEVAELQARLESAADVIGVPATSPEIDEDALAVLAWQDPHLQGDAPQFGSPEWAELEPEDPRREAAIVRAAASYWRLGDTPERLRERTEAAEDRATSIEISLDLERQRDEAHRERVQRETEERQAEEQRQRDLARRPVEVTPAEMAVDGLAAAELDYRDPDMSETDREVARLYLESQGVAPEPEEPEASDEPVVWPELAPIPDPEAETESPGHTQSGPGSREDPEHEEQGEYEATIPDLEPPAPADERDVNSPPSESRPWIEPVIDEPAPEPEDDEPEPDEERFQEGLRWSLEQAARQREADERAAAERVERETAAPEPEPEPEPARDTQADRDAQIEADLAHARAAAARLEAQREADERAADEAARWEPEPEPEPEVELVD